jgi:hypothetical protein
MISLSRLIQMRPIGTESLRSFLPLILAVLLPLPVEAIEFHEIKVASCVAVIDLGEFGQFCPVESVGYTVLLAPTALP